MEERPLPSSLAYQPSLVYTQFWTLDFSLFWSSFVFGEKVFLWKKLIADIIFDVLQWFRMSILFL